MADIIQGDAVVALSNRELNALTELFEKQEPLDPRLVDLNNQLQTL